MQSGAYRWRPPLLLLTIFLFANFAAGVHAPTYNDGHAAAAAPSSAPAAAAVLELARRHAASYADAVRVDRIGDAHLASMRAHRWHRVSAAAQHTYEPAGGEISSAGIVASNMPSSILPSSVSFSSAVAFDSIDLRRNAEHHKDPPAARGDLNPAEPREGEVELSAHAPIASVLPPAYAPNSSSAAQPAEAPTHLLEYDYDEDAVHRSRSDRSSHSDKKASTAVSKTSILVIVGVCLFLGASILFFCCFIRCCCKQRSCCCQLLLLTFLVLISWVILEAYIWLHQPKIGQLQVSLASLACAYMIAHPKVAMGVGVVTALILCLCGCCAWRCGCCGRRRSSDDDDPLTGQSRSDDDDWADVSEEIRIASLGAVLLKANDKWGTGEERYVTLIPQTGMLTWRHPPGGGAAGHLRRAKQLDLSTVTEVDYGSKTHRDTASTTHPAVDEAPPPQCFTLNTRDRSYHFVCHDEPMTQSFVLAISKHCSRARGRLKSPEEFEEAKAVLIRPPKAAAKAGVKAGAKAAANKK